MKIYIEMIFLENAIINFILLSETVRISKKCIKKKEILKAALLGAFYACIGIIFKFNNKMYIFLNILTYTIMIYVTFKDKKIKDFTENILSCVYIFSMYAGLNFIIVNIFNIKNKGGGKVIVYLITYILLRLISKRLDKKIKLNLTKENLIYDLEVFVQDKIFKYKAFVDTGNNVKDISSNMNYVFLEDLSFCLEYLKLCNYRENKINLQTVATQNRYIGYKVDKIKFITNNIEYEIENVPVIFVDKKLNSKNNFNSLIGYDMYLDYLGGMKNE